MLLYLNTNIFFQSNFAQYFLEQKILQTKFVEELEKKNNLKFTICLR